MNLKSRLVEFIFIVFLTSYGSASAQVTYNVLAGFDQSVPAATQPTVGVIEVDGALYGTTQNSNFCGAVYKLTPGEGRDVLHVFKGRTETPADGCQPTGELVKGPDGFLYGTTMSGGDNADDTYTAGTGTIFRILPSFHDGDPVGYEVLYHFRGRDASNIYPDGVAPLGGLTLDPDGNFLFGMTGGGGAGVVSTTDICNQSAPGTFFRFTPPSTLDVLRSFVPAEACNPKNLNSLSNGNFVGAASAASLLGNPQQTFGGTVFEITPEGNIIRLFRFPSVGSPYGVGPESAPVEDVLGNLYGTTSGGGPPSSDGTPAGTVYELSPAGPTWNPRVLHGFTGPDGAYPVAGLTIGADGNFYGVTSGGGTFTNGTVFRISPEGALSAPPLHTFGCVDIDCTTSDPNDGFVPQGRLLEVSPGEFTGTTTGGNGATIGGSVFRVALLSATATALSTSTNSAVFGQSVTFSVSVSSAGGNPTGDVEFFDGAASLGTAILSGGQAMLATTSLGVGAHSISAKYLGDGTFQESTSPDVSVTVSRAQTTTTLGSSPNPSSRKQAVALTATVAAVVPGSGIATGQVQFFDGKKKLGTATPVNGLATLQVSFNNMGNHDLTATYSGDANFVGSSAVLTHAVNK